MDLSPVNDFFSNIKDKLTNPFFGTLIIVWFTRNWELVYSVFNFDEKHNLNTKVEFIKNYWSTKDFLVDLTICAWHTLLLMLAGYFVIIVTRGISIFVEHNAMPWITKKIINKNYVLKDEYDIVDNERNVYFNNFESERARVRQFSKDYEQQMSLYNELDILYKKAIRDISDKDNSNKKLTEHLLEANDLNTKLQSEIKREKDQVTGLKEKLTTKDLELDKNLLTTLELIFSKDNNFQQQILKGIEDENKIVYNKSNFIYEQDFILAQDILYKLQNSNLGDMTFSSAITIVFLLNDNGIKFIKLLRTLCKITDKKR